MPAVPRGIAAVLLCALAGAGLACGGGEELDQRRGSLALAVAPPSTGPRITADGTILGEFNGGVGLLGCCVPLPK